MLGDLSGHSGKKLNSPIKFKCVITKKKNKVLRTSYVRSSIHSYHKYASVSGYNIIFIESCVRELDNVTVLLRKPSKNSKNPVVF